LKRLYISIALMALVLTVAGYAMWNIYHIKQELLDSLEQIQQVSQLDDQTATLQLTMDFTKRWAELKKNLTRFVRHNQLEEITGLVEQLNAFAQYDDKSNLHACLDRIAGCLEDIWHNELPYLHNIL
jgi:hypothetical protein